MNYAGAFGELRDSTLALFDHVDDAAFRRQLHPDFSPVGWHLGHVAYTEAAWILRTAAGRALPRPELEHTFHVDGLAKADRDGIPGYDVVASYAREIRDEVLEWFAGDRVDDQARLIHFVLQHECQHNETINLLQHFARADGTAELTGGAPDLEFLPIPGGLATVGSTGPAAMDNEGPIHQVEIEPFVLARYPVTQAQYAAFMADGGYRNRALWSEAGWRWRLAEEADRPLYWTQDALDHPVAGVSWFEAEAFCRWAGARLPTEHEWEWAATGPEALDMKTTVTATRDKAAAAPGPNLTAARQTPWGGAEADWRHCTCEARRTEPARPNGPGGTSPVDAHPNGASRFGVEDMLGNVWEWTSSLFGPYPGFTPWPYPGYSQAYFDGRHYVLRGGSWATRRWAMRTSFRNWYLPEIRQILAGFRCARDI